MLYKKFYSKKGFTLVELLITIAIIGTLSTLAVIALGNVRAKARASKRVSDIKQIASAIELYYSENSAYPENINFGGSLVSPDGLTTYMAKIPSNPSPRNDGSCLDSDYNYVPVNHLAAYKLKFCTGTKTEDLRDNEIIYTPNGFTSSSHFSK